LGGCYLHSNEKACALWFFTLAFIEDALTTGENTPKNPATRALNAYFNLSDALLADIGNVAHEYLKSHPDCGRYPEAIIVELARNKGLPWYGTDSNTDLGVNSSFLRVLTRQLTKGTAAHKKKSLEFLASYLSLTLPNVRIIPNAQAFEHEMDLIVIQQTGRPTYLLEALGRSFLVECKNWRGKVGVEQINHFVAKMRFHGCQCGILFARNGLSGKANKNEGVSFSRLTQLRWYQQDRCLVILVDAKSLLELESGLHPNFSALLLRGYESVRFSLPES
jgi:hypothetical protein